MRGLILLGGGKLLDECGSFSMNAGRLCMIARMRELVGRPIRRSRRIARPADARMESWKN
jgi:hypothetical protein